MKTGGEFFRMYDMSTDEYYADIIHFVSCLNRLLCVLVCLLISLSLSELPFVVKKMIYDGTGNTVEICTYQM